MTAESGNNAPSRPVLFSDIAKPTRDLLNKGFSAGHMLLVSYLSPAGPTLSTTATLGDGVFVGIMNCSLKKQGTTTELSVSNIPQLTATTSYEDLFPGLKLTLSTVVPDPVNLGKTQVQYQNEYSSFTANIHGFKTKPSLELAANVGSERLSVGGSVTYDTDKNQLTASLAGFGFRSPDVSAALTIDPKNTKSVDAYCSQSINNKASWGCHLNHKWETRLSTATVGGSYKMDPFTTIKSRVNNHGMVGALLEYEPSPLVTFGMYAEVDTKALTTTKPKVGFSLALLTSS